MNDERIEQIIQLEFQMFQAVSNRGGRASCQDDYATFEIMRSSQFSAWPPVLRESYWRDLEAARAEGRNLLTEKYARMMEETHPDEFAELEETLPRMSPGQKDTVERIMELQSEMTRELYEAFPLTCAAGRPFRPDPRRPGATSAMTYLRGELCTYSEQTLACYLEVLRHMRSEGRNLPREILEQTARRYGYSGLEEREAYLWKQLRASRGE